MRGARGWASDAATG